MAIKLTPRGKDLLTKMFGELHRNFVLYRNDSGDLGEQVPAGAQYKQIVVVEKTQFEVRIFEGDVVQPEPNFAADNPDAEVYLHENLRSAVEDAAHEYQESIAAGWRPYNVIGSKRLCHRRDYCYFSHYPESTEHLFHQDRQFFPVPRMRP